MGFVGRQPIPGPDRGPAEANHQFPALPTGFFCKNCHGTHYQKARLMKSSSQAPFLQEKTKGGSFPGWQRLGGDAQRPVTIL
jgi:hypothetical protein